MKMATIQENLNAGGGQSSHLFWLSVSGPFSGLFALAVKATSKLCPSSPSHYKQ